MKTTIRALLSTVLLASAVIASTGFAPNSAIHFGLAKSAPAADSTVAAPAEVRLWFTQEPSAGTISIRVVGAEEANVHVDDVVQDPEDPKAFAVALHGTLPSGTYTVSWRGMGADGHVVRETFDFTVATR